MNGFLISGLDPFIPTSDDSQVSRSQAFTMITTRDSSLVYGLARHEREAEPELSDA